MSRVRSALLRRVDHVWDMGWLNLVGIAIIGFFLFLTSMPLSAGIDNLRAERWGVGGTLMLNRCAVDEWAKGDPWLCHGDFVSTDGTLRISGVRYGIHFDEDPRAEGKGLNVDARVAGPRSSKAWPPGNEWQSALIVGIFGLILTGLVFLWWISPEDSAAPASPLSRGGRRGRTRRVRRLGHARRRRSRR
ncbi:hypothetical protein ABZ754_11010 [Micromonospora purpureochromogenes]|uniref:hypothetical protein n=1 Tax=Micromonospora purpureochromogenes TaxID=47872 RepID=UPI0033EBA81C